VILGLGRINLKHLIVLRKINFYRRLYIPNKCMLRDVFWTFLLRNGGEMVKTVYVKKSTAFKMVYDEYESYAAII